MGLFGKIKNKITDVFAINENNVLSYGRFLKDIQDFKNSGTRTGSEFNLFDTPGKKFFKILFYFGVDNDMDIPTGGLLSPTWNTIGNNTKYYEYNSAWAYLKMNDENERAEKLEQFVSLLSNINSNSPWYFSSINGLQEAIERKPATDGKFEIPDDRKFTITCLPDAFDNRLTTLLELYRDITWSWSNKREILPANLRKFDMAIYIFESPTKFWHDKDDTLGINNGKFRPSYKMFEFHNCEIDYNSIKSGWNEINNSDGFTPVYTIEIKYDDCYEVSYNEFMMRQIGDVITTDLGLAIESIAQEDSQIQSDELAKRANPHDKGLIGNTIGQLVGAGKNWLEDKAERALLGNLHTYSLTQIGSQLKSAMQGNVFSTVQAAKDYIKEANERKAVKETASGNLFPQQKAAMKVKAKGNIFKDVTIVNNI